MVKYETKLHSHNSRKFLDYLKKSPFKKFLLFEITNSDLKMLHILTIKNFL